MTAHIERDTITAPARWCSALVSHYLSGFDTEADGDQELRAIERLRGELMRQGFVVLDVARNANGSPLPPYHAPVHAGGPVPAGALVRDYVIARVA